MHILHLIDALDNDDSARQLELLTLACQTGPTEVCCLGPSSRQAEALRSRGARVHVLGWTRWLDAASLLRLRELVRGGGFDLIHVWRIAALRALALVAADVLPRAIVSAPLPVAHLPWWDRQLLRRVRCLVLTGEEQRQRSMRHGLGSLPWRTIPVAAPDCDVVPPAWALRYPRRIACAGRLERGGGFREAIWAVDILRYVFPDVHLLLAGDGPFRADLEAMIRRLDIRNAHLLGDAMDATDVLAAAHVCWVPSRVDCGRRRRWRRWRWGVRWWRPMCQDCAR